MADNERSGSGWLGFIAGIIVITLIGVAIYAYSVQPQRTAQLQVNVPSLKINPPDVRLPAPPPAPTVPPSAPTNSQP